MVPPGRGEGIAGSHGKYEVHAPIVAGEESTDAETAMGKYDFSVLRETAHGFLVPVSVKAPRDRADLRSPCHGTSRSASAVAYGCPPSVDDVNDLDGVGIVLHCRVE